jgi:hypothetical protein
MCEVRSVVCTGRIPRLGVPRSVVIGLTFVTGLGTITGVTVQNMRLHSRPGIDTFKF